MAAKTCIVVDRAGRSNAFGRRPWGRPAAALLLALAAVVTGWLALSGARVLRPLVVDSVLLGLLGLAVLFRPVPFRTRPATVVADAFLSVLAVALVTVTVVQTRPWEYTWWPGNTAAAGTLDVCAVAPDVVRRLVPGGAPAGQEPGHRPAGEHRHCQWRGDRFTTMSLSYQPFEARHLAARFYTLESSVYTDAGAPAPGSGDPGRFEVSRVADNVWVHVVVRRANVVVSVIYHAKVDEGSVVELDRVAADVVAVTRAATGAVRLG